MSSQKITERHRQRRAVVYVRQSSPGQLERNTESTARQYALRERAVALGWPAASVVGGRRGHRAAPARARTGGWGSRSSSPTSAWGTSG